MGLPSVKWDFYYDKRTPPPLGVKPHAMVLVEREPEALIDRLKSCRLPEVSKRMARGQT
jgi:hypothetical protein